MRDVVDTLRDLRETAKQCGHVVDRVSIGIDGDTVRACDDSGAYDYHRRTDGRLVRVCVGAPSRALEAIATHPSLRTL
jgi:hypothetical protein